MALLNTISHKNPGIFTVSSFPASFRKYIKLCLFFLCLGPLGKAYEVSLRKMAMMLALLLKIKGIFSGANMCYVSCYRQLPTAYSVGGMLNKRSGPVGALCDCALVKVGEGEPEEGDKLLATSEAALVCRAM